ncbi:sugar ABC transporter ATP-binding protein [Tepidibacillus infernus]|uniref:D-ribose transporter ATP-binding protein n=1 Tax=Tepidibacillus decaturensis TaxID=1413211 RepID=A0A135L5K0_9BACI|nr:sugar ABC transporter ATP-binding protein [Tepidibacillus decaturensis]KXG44187.1 D-ribose transporter ATP-binding protein [Tepidibacillus decaturensis]
MENQSNQLLIEMKGIYKSFFHVKVLENVDFSICSGEVHALMGENGAGKSTLMKILTGIYQKDAGEVFVRGKAVHFKGPKEAEQAGIAVIHQELNIIPHLTVAENMFLGRELRLVKTGILRNKEMKQKTEEYLKRLGIEIDPDIPAGELSVGMQQMIEIAKAISLNAKVIIMDEPTAALTEKEIKTLFTVIRQLKDQGVGIVYISHRMEEIFTICDRITVLRDGQYIGTKLISEVHLDDIVKMMVGRQLGERYPKRNVQIGKERLRVEGLTRKGKFQNLSFEAYEGEIIGVAGLMGAGRTEIVEAIFGINKDGGDIYVDGQKIKVQSPYDAIASGIGFVTEDRKQEGLVLGLSVRENLVLPNLDRISTKSIVNNKIEEAFVDDLVGKLSIKTSGHEQVVKSLSGGNQQKVVIGKWLGINPKILILDEPTRGVDIGAKKEIYHIMNQLTEQGVTIIMVSSELPEILGMSDRIIVVHEGQITAILTQKEADQEKIMYYATGGK